MGFWTLAEFSTGQLKQVSNPAGRNFVRPITSRNGVLIMSDGLAIFILSWLTVAALAYFAVGLAAHRFESIDVPPLAKVHFPCPNCDVPLAIDADGAHIIRQLLANGAETSPSCGNCNCPLLFVFRERADGLVDCVAVKRGADEVAESCE